MLCSSALGAPADVRAFRDEVIEIGRRNLPEMPLRPGRDDREILSGEHDFRIDNLYTSTRSMTAIEKEAEITRWLRTFSPAATVEMNSILRSSENWTTARSLLRPLLLPASLTAQARRLVSQPFSTDLVIGYAIDAGPTMIYLQQNQFARWHVGLDEVHDNALANLDGSTDKVPIAVETEGGKPVLASVVGGDSYDSSRILLPKIRRRLIDILGVRVLAATPARTSFLAWSTTSSARADNVERVHRDVEKLPHPLSDEIFVLSEDRVRPARPEELGL